MSKCKKTSIGGQALIEGIMMKGPDKTAMAVRLPDGNIDITYLEDKAPKDICPLFALPIIRGVANFVASMVQGYKALMLSADKSGFTELEEKDGKTKKLPDWVMAILMFVSGALGVLLAVALFFALPTLLVDGLEYIFGSLPSVLCIALEQICKLALFVGYVFAVSFMNDIKRVFMYHGAEHKTIFCYEKGLPLTVENIKQQRRLHPRCGTSFMILMILVSFLISLTVEIVFPGVNSISWLWMLIKLLLVPLCCGVGYEVLKFCGRHDNLFTKIVSAPGLWLQRITTKEPDDSMMEIAAAALTAVLPKENCDEQ